MNCAIKDLFGSMEFLRVLWNIQEDAGEVNLQIFSKYKNISSLDHCFEWPQSEQKGQKIRTTCRVISDSTGLPVLANLQVP